MMPRKDHLASALRTFAGSAVNNAGVPILASVPHGLAASTYLAHQPMAAPSTVFTGANLLQVPVNHWPKDQEMPYPHVQSSMTPAPINAYQHVGYPQVRVAGVSACYVCILCMLVHNGWLMYATK